MHRPGTCQVHYQVRTELYFVYYTPYASPGNIIRSVIVLVLTKKCSKILPGLTIFKS